MIIWEGEQIYTGTCLKMSEIGDISYTFKGLSSEMWKQTSILKSPILHLEIAWWHLFWALAYKTCMSNFGQLGRLQLHCMFSAVRNDVLNQWFPNFFSARSTSKILVVREAQKINLNCTLRTTWANLAEQTLGLTELHYSVKQCFPTFPYSAP